MMDYEKMASSIKEEIIKTLKEWISFPSVLNESEAKEGAPFGNAVKGALDYIADVALNDGFSVDKCDGYCSEITYGDGDGLVLVLGHADVVPSGKGWDNDPFIAIEKDGKIYGRGTSDDKGPTLAAYYALKLIKENNLPIKRKIRIVVGGNEESGSRCLDYYFDTLKKPHGDYGFSPDADFPLIYGEKGIMTYIFKGEIKDDVVSSFNGGVASNSVPDSASVVLKGVHVLEEKLTTYCNDKKLRFKVEVKNDTTIIEMFGKSSHGGSPWIGINAATHLMNFIANNFDCKLFKHFAPLLLDYYGSGLGINYIEEEMGNVSVNTGIVNYESGKYLIVCNIRYPKSVKGEDIISKVDTFRLHEGKCLGDSKPLYVSPSSTLVRVLHEAYQSVSKDYESKPYTISGGTYARHTSNSVAFGMAFPGEDNKIHQENEYVKIDSLIKGVAIYLKALLDLANI